MAEEELTIEQQFELVKVASQIESVRNEDLRILFMDLYESTMRRENATKKLIAHQWGIDRVAS